MQGAELEVGREYARIPAVGGSTTTTNADRVRVLVVKSGAITIEVLDAVDWGAWAEPALAPGATASVRPRTIVCLWEQWPAEVARRDQYAHEIAAARSASYKEAQRPACPDPLRDVPATYGPAAQFWPGSSPQALSARYREATTASTAEAVDGDALLGELPELLVADLLSALTFRYSQVQEKGSVRQVLSRAAGALERARHDAAGTDGHGGRGPRWKPTDTEFLQAVVASFAARGEVLRLPLEPELPSWVWATTQGSPPPPGWLRLAYVPTSGYKRHAAYCRRVGPRAVAHLPTVAAWRVTLEQDPCGVCYGPWFANGIHVARLYAAADVWTARGRTGIETWQEQTALALIGADTAARVAQGEPDMTTVARVADALARTAVDTAQVHAVHVALQSWQRGPAAMDMGPATVALLRERLNLASERLGDAAPPLSTAAPTDELLRRWHELHQLGLPRIDEFLWGPRIP